MSIHPRRCCGDCANALDRNDGALSRHTHGCAGGIWSLYLGTVLLGKIDEATMKVYG